MRSNTELASILCGNHNKKCYCDCYIIAVLLTGQCICQTVLELVGIIICISELSDVNTELTQPLQR